MVSLAGAFGEILYLIVLRVDLGAEEFVLPFQACDIARHELVIGRGRPRLVATCRGSSGFLFVPCFLIA